MHRINRKIFFDVDASQPLLRLYARLVALELTLKDYDSANRAKEHDVVGMVGKLTGLPDISSLSALATALNTALQVLRCTLKSGAVGPVNPKIYPGLRYLRHEADFPGETKDADLEKAIQALDALWKELQRQGVKP